MYRTTISVPFVSSETLARLERHNPGLAKTFGIVLVEDARAAEELAISLFNAGAPTMEYVSEAMATPSPDYKTWHVALTVGGD